jgi:hypothetical protein
MQLMYDDKSIYRNKEFLQRKTSLPEYGKEVFKCINGMLGSVAK